MNSIDRDSPSIRMMPSPQVSPYKDNVNGNSSISMSESTHQRKTNGKIVPAQGCLLAPTDIQSSSNNNCSQHWQYNRYHIDTSTIEVPTPHIRVVTGGSCDYSNQREVRYKRSNMVGRSSTINAIPICRSAHALREFQHRDICARIMRLLVQSTVIRRHPDDNITLREGWSKEKGEVAGHSSMV